MRFAALAFWVFAATTAICLREAPAAVSSSQYAVIAPIYDGSAASGGSSSFIRLFNGNSTATTFTITVVGSPTGRIYGVASYVVPKNASPQKYFNDILTAAGAAPLTAGDTGYAFYLQNLDFYAGYQHVTFNGATSFFENASICARMLNQPLATASGSGVLLNVHTTKLAGWPSKLQIYNSSGASASYQVSAVDSDTGAALGNSTTVAVAASEFKTMTMTTLQAAMGIVNPAINQVNLIVSNPSDSNLGAVIGHQVTNTALAADFNLTMACAANPFLTAAPAASATTTFQGTMGGSANQSGTFSVTVQTSIASSTLEVQSSAERAQAAAQAAGALQLSGGSAVALTGTYDSASNTFGVTGGGFALSGSINNGVFAGTYTAPSNATGVFSSLNATQSTPTLYCGTWTDQGDHGTFSINIAANGKLSGISAGGKGVALTGQAVGTTFSGITTDNVRFTGTIQNTSISGSGVNNGTTFSGSVCSPPA